MGGFTINSQCHACGAWVDVAQIVMHPTDSTSDRCPECDGFFYEQFDDFVQKPCEDCGTLVRWPADDESGVICRTCIRKLIEVAS